MGKPGSRSSPPDLLSALDPPLHWPAMAISVKCFILGILGDWLFYDMGTRRNDFTGYIPKNKPIILIDDNLGTQGASLAMSSRINIPDFQTIKPTIIKVIRGEEFPGDVKCLEVIIVKAAYAVIISNNPLLFRTYAVDQNLAARGRLIHFPRRGSPR